MARIAAYGRRAFTAVYGFFSEQEADAQHGDVVVMARALGLLFFAGGAIGLVSVLLPQAHGAHPAGIVAVCLAAIAVSGALFKFGRRVPRWMFAASLYGGTLLIEIA